MAIFTGAGVAIVTPFKENGEVDYETFAKNIEFQIEKEPMQLLYAEQQEKHLLFHMRNI